jgi:hypothetical protein
MAIAKENGMEIMSARKEVSSVPIKNGKAPYTLLTGSQVLLQRYLNPRFFIEGTDSMISVIIRPTTSRTIAIPTAVRDRLKTDSALIIPLEFLAFVFNFWSFTFIVINY